MRSPPPQLAVLKQGEEEFAEQTQSLAMEGYPGVAAKATGSLAVDSFLQGCREKQAALIIMEKEPRSVHKALKGMKCTILAGKVCYTLSEISVCGARGG